jgi:capsule assembly protein Wzi
MIEYPYLLGNNAPGFPQVFAGSSRPVSIGVGRIHGRIFYGELSQSDYTTISASVARRFASGFAAVFTPRWVPGLELGLARFVHAPWPNGGLTSADFRKLVEGLVIRRNPNSPTGFSESDTTNQLASAFVRWVLPKSGFEVYGEFGREDHGWDRRDVLLEPDHSSSLGIGFRKAWLRRVNDVLVLRGEILDFRLPVLWRFRGEGGTYLHPIVRQGHTHRGQLLGAEFGVGSSQALTLELDQRSATGGLRASWSSAVRREGTAPGMSPDVQHVVELEKSFSRGPLELAIGLSGVYEFNRDFSRDARNYNGTMTLRWSPQRARPRWKRIRDSE